LQGCDANGDKIWAIDSDKAYDIENALSDYVSDYLLIDSGN
jgi:hypothetical protein